MAYVTDEDNSEPYLITLKLTDEQLESIYIKDREKKLQSKLDAETKLLKEKHPIFNGDASDEEIEIVFDNILRIGPLVGIDKDSPELLQVLEKYGLKEKWKQYTQ